MDQKIIYFLQEKAKLKKKNSKNRKNPKNIKMLFFIVIIAIIAGLFCWNIFVENVAIYDVKIPSSKNITYNYQDPISLTSTQIANEFEKFEGKPIFLYIYTTWCSVCKKTTPKINEIAREFQNTNLKFMAIAIDKNLDGAYLKDYLNDYGNIYFQPQYLAFKDGFKELLLKKKIKYDKRIPFAVLISADGESIKTISVTKSQNYLRNKIIKELYL